MTEWKDTPKGPWAIPNLKKWDHMVMCNPNAHVSKEAPGTYTLNVKVVQLEILSRAISSGRASFLDLLFGSVERVSNWLLYKTSKSSFQCLCNETWMGQRT